MIFDLPEGLKDIGYLQGLDSFLWIVFINLSLFGAGYLFYRAISIEITTQKKMFFYWGLFFLFYATFCRLFFIIAVIYSEFYDFFTILGYIFGIIGYFFLMFAFENYVFGTYKIFSSITIFSVVLMVISLFLGVPRHELLIYISLITIAITLILFLIYIFIIYKTAGEIRKKTIEGLIGMFLYATGHLLDSELLLSTHLVPLVLPPIIQIIGFILWLDATRVIDIIPDFFHSKRICIIHRGEIKKKIIMCKNCNILYCERCYEFIMQSDKKCWFCKTPFTSEDDIISEEIKEIPKGESELRKLPKLK